MLIPVHCMHAHRPSALGVKPTALLRRTRGAAIPGGRAGTGVAALSLHEAAVSPRFGFLLISTDPFSVPNTAFAPRTN
jgi:hypothetical protein